MRIQQMLKNLLKGPGPQFHSTAEQQRQSQGDVLVEEKHEPLRRRDEGERARLEVPEDGRSRRGCVETSTPKKAAGFYQRSIDR